MSIKVSQEAAVHVHEREQERETSNKSWKSKEDPLFVLICMKCR